jgi:hypothetical protein
MKKLPTQSSLVAVGLIAGLSILAGSAQAQLNEKKIERDASGVYTGNATGGVFTVTYDDPFTPPFSFPAEPGDGKIRVPVKDGKLKTAMSDDALPGEGSASAVGKEQKSKVTRGGKKIIVKAVGTFVTDEGPTHGPWVGGKISGDLTDKGRKWSADTTCGAYQRNGSPPDHTRRLSGRVLKGKG